jgi:hypothetical protein
LRSVESLADAVTVNELPDCTSVADGVRLTVGLVAAAVFTSTAPIRKKAFALSKSPNPSLSPPRSASTT